MIFWLDAQLPPGPAPWLSSEFGIAAISIRDIGLRNATDQDIFAAAREADASLVSKDADFSDRIIASEPPPRVIHLRVGNMRLAALRIFLSNVWPTVEKMIASHKLVHVYRDRMEGISSQLAR